MIRACTQPQSSPSGFSTCYTQPQTVVFFPPTTEKVNLKCSFNQDLNPPAPHLSAGCSPVCSQLLAAFGCGCPSHLSSLWCCLLIPRGLGVKGKMAFLNSLTPLSDSGLVFPPMKHVPCSNLAFEVDWVWTWEAGIRQDRSSSATGLRGGEDRWAAKNISELRAQQEEGIPLLHVLVANTMHPHHGPHGTRDGHVGGCFRHPQAAGTCAPTHAHWWKGTPQSTRTLWPFWTWPAKPCPWGEARIFLCARHGGIGCFQEGYSWSSLSGTCVYLGEPEGVMNLPSAYQAEVESRRTIIIAVAGHILWLACQVEVWMQFVFVFALVRDKRLFCLLRCFESFNSVFVLLGLGIIS